jgi:hypothetical protein
MICKPQPEGHVFFTTTKKLVNSAPLEGQASQSYTQHVFYNLKSLTVGTDAWEWIKMYDQQQNGHLAFKALREHYDGPGEIGHCITLAKSQIKSYITRASRCSDLKSLLQDLMGPFRSWWSVKRALLKRLSLMK